VTRLAAIALAFWSVLSCAPAPMSGLSLLRASADLSWPLDECLPRSLGHVLSGCKAKAVSIKPAERATGVLGALRGSVSFCGRSAT